MNLKQQLLMGVLLLLVGFLLNRAIENHKSKKAKENQEAKLRDEKHIEFLGRQLSEFFWPLYIRLEKDRSIWRRILDINKEKGSLEQRLGRQIEKNVILPNHKAMIEIIETRIYLAQPKKELIEELMKYVKRATEYQALRDADDLSHFSMDEIGTEWLHQGLFEEIESITNTLQSRFNKLVGEP
jgi:hypothetical protein